VVLSTPLAVGAWFTSAGKGVEGIQYQSTTATAKGPPELEHMRDLLELPVGNELIKRWQMRGGRAGAIVDHSLPLSQDMNPC